MIQNLTLHVSPRMVAAYSPNPFRPFFSKHKGRIAFERTQSIRYELRSKGATALMHTLNENKRVHCVYGAFHRQLRYIGFNFVWKML